MTTIKSRDGRYTIHGVFIRWADEHGGFEFDAVSKRHFYGNLDYWDIINSNPLIPIGRIRVKKEGGNL